MTNGSNTVPDAESEQTLPDKLPHAATYQRTLLPIDVITSYANDQGSADLQSIVEARDGRHYALKSISDGNGRVPASELFCYELAYRVVIPTPAYSLIKLPSGELAFGSQWEGGVINGAPQINFQMFIYQVLSGQIKVTNLKTFLSRLYAFDLFVNNVDRHWGNYLWRNSHGDKLIALAFDFGRSQFETGHTGFEALDPKQNTQIVFNAINQHKHYDRSQAVDCLESIRAIGTEEITAILSNFPGNWMPNSEKESYIKWWDSDDRIARIDTLLKRV